MTEYVAGKEMVIAGERRKIGDPLPEAASWPGLDALLKLGDVRIEDGAEYVLGRSMTIGGVLKTRGEAIPEAKRWPNLDLLLRLGDVKRVAPRPVSRPMKKSA